MHVEWCREFGNLFRRSFQLLITECELSILLIVVGFGLPAFGDAVRTIRSFIGFVYILKISFILNFLIGSYC